MQGRSDHSTPNQRGRQVVHVEVGGGYRPAVVRARPGEALRVVFHRLDDDACTSRVIFSTPRLERRLAAHGSTSIDLPAQAAGDIRYTCGMGRYSGVIRLEEAPASRLTALGRAAHQLGGAISIALFVALVGLPVVAAMAFVGLGPISAAIAAVVVLAAAVVVASHGLGKNGNGWRRSGPGPAELPGEGLPITLAGTPGRSRSRPGS